MADNRLAGTAFVAVDGRSYALVGAGTYRVSQSTRETLMGQDGFHGFKEMPAPGRISWTGRDGSGTAIGALANANDVTVTLELINGKTIVGRNMSRVGEPVEVNSEEGTFEIAFEGPDVSEN
jgi:hypothetical protein